ncbi:MAG: L-2-hydroxyglutarate oxidase LhgO, partial [Alphaproteobacteria bacterium]
MPEIVRAHKVGTMTEKTDCIVIGAGVVGLGIARALAMAGREVIILETEDAFGLHTSSRNTGCIHAGIHYLPGSLKNRLAFRGKELLYRYCPEH